MNSIETKISNKFLDVILTHLKKYGAKKISLFGSYSKGTQETNSDLDLIVEFSGRKSLLELIRIERELSEMLNVKVDLLTEKSISPYILQSIKNEIIHIT